MEYKVDTSNFAKQSKNINSISIARQSPIWYNGLMYSDLYPDWSIIMNHKNKIITDDEYKFEYFKQLNKLNPDILINDLNNKIILCGCKSNSFCHRHLVIEYLLKYFPNLKTIEI